MSSVDTATDSEKVRILAVDDRKEHLLAMESILDRPDYDVVMATSGREALGLALRSDFALIILDVAMPEMDGFETATLLRQRERARLVPIIFVSAELYDMEHIFKAYGVGAVDFLPKPIDAHTLRAKVAIFAELFRKAREIERKGLALQEAERRRRELAESLYDVTFEDAPIGIGHTNLKGEWLRVNKRFSEILGAPREKLLHRTTLELLHPDDRSRLAAAVDTVVAGADAKRHRGEYRFVRGDGLIVWAQLTLSLLRDPAGHAVQLVIMEDITEVKRLEASLQAAEVRFTRLRESGLLGIFYQQSDGTIVEANDAFLRLIGYSREDLQALKIRLHDLTPAAYLEADARARKEILAHGVSSIYEKELARKDGRRVAVLAGDVAADGPEHGSIGFALDITGRKEVEMERARALRELGEGIRARDDFLSIAAHELRGPLTPILTQVTSLLEFVARRGEPIDPGWLARQLQPVRRAVDNLEALINTLLDVSRITVGRLELELAETDLVSVVRESVERIRSDAEGARCSITVRAAAPVMGRWDRTRLQQAVGNLLSNAVKYGFGKPIEIDVEGESSRARFSVRDYGIGIPPEHQARLFERFERLVPVRHYGGFGLGLWLVRQIVEAHGGTVEVWSASGMGSRFTVDLPREPATRSLEPGERSAEP